MRACCPTHLLRRAKHALVTKRHVCPLEAFFILGRHVTKAADASKELVPHTQHTHAHAHKGMGVRGTETRW